MAYPKRLWHPKPVRFGVEVQIRRNRWPTWGQISSGHKPALRAVAAWILGHNRKTALSFFPTASVVDFLLKPVDEQDLQEAVSRAIEEDRYIQGNQRKHAAIAWRVATLTAREREVMCLVVTGRPNKQIADDLGTSEKTIKVHRGRVMQKMQAMSVAGLVRMADTVGTRSL